MLMLAIAAVFGGVAFVYVKKRRTRKPAQ